ncbi:ATP-binding cassette domain-containing protein [Enterococcus hirae]|uniref:ATP-binding cassette domain-containing protein n=1 Tax=Enterococcus hirae TaxID=1354 RepID=UPI00235154D1|nr:ATP-binding cassette domain-containing protein [Enterococcus hirae]
MNPIIDVQNLSKVYNRTTVLDNISFQIAPGETVALLGENGAGKSTLINLLNQLIQPNSGTTYVMGTQDIRKVRDKVGVMLQQNLSLERVTVKECLNLARSYYHNPLSYEALIRLANLKKKRSVT